jgi:RNA polymerase sigma-70 factor (ECF subfamily)
MEDKKLIESIRAGDQKAFEHLINLNQRLVGHMIGRLISDEQDRDEVSQDVFIKVYQKIHTFSFNSKLSTWIATIAYREAANYLRKNKKWSESTENGDIPDEGSWDLSFEDQDYTSYIHSWIEKLPYAHRTVLTLYHLEGMSYPEIVKIMDLPEGTIKSHLFRARKKLKVLLQPHLNTEVYLHG